MNMRKFLKTTLAIILIAGAGIIAYNMQKTETLSEQACDNVEIINYAHAEIKGMSDIPDTLLGDKKYIFLDNGNSDTFVSMITKVAMTAVFMFWILNCPKSLYSTVKERELDKWVAGGRESLNMSVSQTSVCRTMETYT